MSASLVRRVAVAAVLIGGVLLSLLVVRVGVSDLVLQAGEARLAAAVWSGNARAVSQEAEDLARFGKLKSAQVRAIDALHLSAQDSQALRTIAAISASAGDTASADTATVIAAHLGWRDRFAQERLFQSALARQDLTAAVQAGDALMRIGARPATVFPAFVKIASLPQGRAELAERMSATPRWAGTFLKQFPIASAEDARTFGHLLLELEARGVRPDYKDVRNFFDSVIARGDTGFALDVWRRANRGTSDDPTTGLVDADLIDLASGTEIWGPFGWRTVERHDGNVEVRSRRESASDQMVEMTVDGSAARAGLSQLLMLAPGTYDLSYEAKLDRGNPRSFRWTMTCMGVRTPLADTDATAFSDAGWTRQRIRVTIPAAGCSAQTLALAARPVGAQSAVAAFASLSLKRAPAAASAN